MLVDLIASERRFVDVQIEAARPGPRVRRHRDRINLVSRGATAVGGSMTSGRAWQRSELLNLGLGNEPGPLIQGIRLGVELSPFDQLRDATARDAQGIGCLLHGELPGIRWHGSKSAQTIR